ncbi:hypothetical protein WR164_10360 [Philodulcilactobacillus myokoensis]|uniref:GtrA/DPMS transmembrane domain-containing protein n=1 Tax=Philodulcilactobacillus myokoensis TaxID=2929573 RepID=A0A9W6B166_9LACO|nr:GtrA family protein [Philodulcilactobacillus myokoensis]GLB47057.1 hypothetical protein WR164_10360 [Philodulcilactobacillus myokoensis]
MKKLINLYQQNKQVISYLFWGVLTTIVSIAVYELLIFSLPQIKFRITIIGAISQFAGIVFAYFTNRKYVFYSNAHNLAEQIKEFWYFFLGRAGASAIEIILVDILVNVGMQSKIEESIANIIGNVFVVIANYFWSKLVVFKKTSK